MVEKNAKRNGTQELATEYLNYLWRRITTTIGRLQLSLYTREKVQAEFAKQFPTVDLLTVEQIIGGWDNAMKTQFANGAKLDELLKR